MIISATQTFTTGYDAASRRVFERLVHAEGRSALYKERDMMGRLIETDRGVISLPQEHGAEPTEIEKPINMPGSLQYQWMSLDTEGNWLKVDEERAGTKPDEWTVIQEYRSYSRDYGTTAALNQVEAVEVTESAASHDDVRGELEAQGTRAIEYDNNGNMTRNGAYEYSYDVFDRLGEVYRGGELIARYYYDTQGRRVRKGVIATDEAMTRYPVLFRDQAGSRASTFAFRDRYIFDSLGRELASISQYDDGRNLWLPIPRQPLQRKTAVREFTFSAATKIELPNERMLSYAVDDLYRLRGISDDGEEQPFVQWDFYGPSRVAKMAQGDGILTTFMDNSGEHSAIQYPDQQPEWGDLSTDRLGYDAYGRPIAKRVFAAGSQRLTVKVVGAEPIQPAPEHPTRWKYQVRLVEWSPATQKWEEVSSIEESSNVPLRLTASCGKTHESCARPEAGRPEPLSGFNTVEANNTEFGVQGSGDHLPSMYNPDTGKQESALPEGYALQPIGVGAIIQDAQLKVTCAGELEVHFSAPNNISRAPARTKRS